MPTATAGRPAATNAHAGLVAAFARASRPVSMDMITVDLDGIADAGIGSEVVSGAGEQRHGVAIDEVAAAAGPSLRLMLRARRACR